MKHHRVTWHCLQIERMTLEAEHVQDPSIAPIDHAPASRTPPVWRGHPVQMQLPPQTGPVKVKAAYYTL